MRRECAQKIKIARLSDNAASLSERETADEKTEERQS